MSRYGVLTQAAEGGYQVTIVADQAAATALRDRLDNKGIESYGVVRVMTERAVVSEARGGEVE